MPCTSALFCQRRSTSRLTFAGTGLLAKVLVVRTFVTVNDRSGFNLMRVIQSAPTSSWRKTSKSSGLVSTAAQMGSSMVRRTPSRSGRVTVKMRDSRNLMAPSMPKMERVMREEELVVVEEEEEEEEEGSGWFRLKVMASERPGLLAKWRSQSSPAPPRVISVLRRSAYAMWRGWVGGAYMRTMLPVVSRSSGQVLPCCQCWIGGSQACFLVGAAVVVVTVK